MRTAQRSPERLARRSHQWAAWLTQIMTVALAAGAAYAAIAASGVRNPRWALVASVAAGIAGLLGARQARPSITQVDRAPSGQAPVSRATQLALTHRPAAGAPPLPVGTGPGFVGRDAELKQLRRALAEACAGQGRLVLVAGEPGIGKTRIACELADQARVAGMQVLSARMWEADGAPAFWPWEQILRSWAETCAPERLAQVLGADAAVIAQLVPEIAARLPGLPAPPQLDAAAARFRQFDTVTRILKRVAGSGPLVVVLDDLHRADASSLRLLQFLAQQVGDTRLLVIGTFRDAQADLSEDFVGVLAELGREPVTRRITLDGLTKDHVARLVKLTAGAEATPGLVAKLCERTGGNPLFLTQLVQPLAGQDDPDLDRFEEAFDTHVPQQVQEVVQQRLRELPAGARAVLAVASVIGREFHLNVLQEASGVDTEPLVELIEQAAGFGVVGEAPGTVGWYRFSHALVRDALYHQLDARRARLHQQVGEALEGLYAPDLGPHLSELANHFAQAANTTKAFEYLTRAGERALGLLAYEEAARLFELGLAQGPGEARRCELLLALADAQTRAGELASAQETFLGAAGSARALGAPEQLARAALGFGGTFLGLVTPSFVEPLERAVTLLEEALATLGAGDSLLRARVLGRLAMALYWQPGAEQRALQERSLALSQQAVEMARRLGDAKVLASVLDTKCFFLLSPDSLQELLDLAAEILSLAEMSGDKQMAQAAHKWRILGFLQRGDAPALDAELDRYARIAGELRQPVHLYWMHILRGTQALMAGRFDLAEQHNLQASGFGQRMEGLDATQLQSGVGAQRFFLRKEQGRLAELEEAIRESARKFPHLPAWRAALALIHAAAGDATAARWEFEQLAANDFDRIPRDLMWLVTIALAAEACAFCDDAQRAATLYELLLPFEQLCVVAGHGFGCLGSVAHFLGQLAATMGQLDEACQHFEVALKANEQIGAQPYLVHTKDHYARALLARGLPGDDEAADALRGQARELARVLGMASSLSPRC